MLEFSLQAAGSTLKREPPKRSGSDAVMQYKGYIGKVEFDDEAVVFHGEVVNPRDVITFQGDSVTELKAAFRGSIDDYLAFRKQRGESPDKPFSGQFVTRIPPELHRRANVAALMSGKSLNAWVADQLRAALTRNEPRDRPKDKKVAKKRA